MYTFFLSRTYVALFISIVAVMCMSVYRIADGDADSLRLNQIQIIASHNSYHLRTDKAVLRFLKNLYGMGLLPKDLNPKDIDYTHATLTEQFEKYGVRGIELDVYNDPSGGRFADRRGLAWVAKRSKSKAAEMYKPGYKILHIPDFDFNTSQLTFTAALAEIKKWSDEHPRHLPLFINVEIKTSAPGDQIHQLPKLAHSANFDSTSADALDKEVKSIFGQQLDGVITPDNVRGFYATLEQAALAGMWPTLASARGKVIFIIDDGGEIAKTYISGHRSCEGRAMFLYAEPGNAEAAFVKQNGSVEDYRKIQQYVKMGYIVRTRCDEGAHEARSGDTGPRQAAMCSWAQILSTDYYRSDARAGTKGWTDYAVRFSGGQLARTDSISAKGLEHIQISE